jgi:hypothetical protein
MVNIATGLIKEVRGRVASIPRAIDGAGKRLVDP